MSTKDLIERLTRTTGTRSARAGAGGTAGEGEEVTKRIGDSVIRRRRVPRASEAEAAPEAMPSTARTVTSTTPTGRVTAVRRPRRDAAPEAPAAPARQASPPTAAAAPPEPAVEPEPPVEAPEFVEPEVQAEAEPTPPPEVEAAEPPAEPTVEPAPEVEQAPVDEAPVAPPVEVAPFEPPPAPVEEAPPPVVEPEPAPPVATKPPAPPPPAEPTAEEERRGATAALASGLPRADGSRPRLAGEPQSFPGLGSAVVRPPPGYDPNDPLGNRRRALRAAAEASTAAARAKEAPKVWRDQTKPAEPAPPRRDREEERLRTPSRKRSTPRRGRIDMYVDEYTPTKRRGRARGKAGPKKQSPQAKAIKRRVEVDGTITVAGLAHGMSVKAGQVIRKLVEMGQVATMNDPLDVETARVVAAEFEYEIIDSTFNEDQLLIDIAEEEEGLQARPVVVTIMGHVDHGKTSLLDYIRHTRVAAGEAGGITQHVAAYQVERGDELITFIDTPGHQAFTEMRARGAQVTDIVVLVVAADDGVMPQTVEAINHAKAADVEILVAVNKVDKANAQPQRVRQQLMEHGLVPEEYGGETIFVDVSATKGTGIDDLLDNLVALAEMGEYGANPDRHAEGTVLEARLERGKGPVATVLVQNGTLKAGDSVVIGSVWGRVRAMSDFLGKRIKVASPSTPVEIMGLEGLPQAGDHLIVVNTDKDARELAEHRAADAKREEMGGTQRVTLEDLLRQQEAEETVSLNLIVKSDVDGTLEAMKNSVGKIAVPGTEVKILHAAVGAITESDVTLAHTYGGIIIGFNVRPDAKAREAVEQRGVEVRTYRVIYEALEDIEMALKGLLGPTMREVVNGMAEIRQTFQVPKIGTVAGCFVTEGKVGRNFSVRLLRDGKVIWDGRLASLRRFKDDVREVLAGYECGMNLDGYNDIKVGDQLEFYSQEAVVE